MLTLALVTMLCAVLAQHTGLAQAIARTIVKIASCAQCCTFWSTLAVLFIAGCDPLVCAAAAMVAAYASHWVSLLLYILNNIYNSLWEKISSRLR